MLEWFVGDDLWEVAREFRLRFDLIHGPPDCASKAGKGSGAMEFCIDDHLVMAMQREMMTRELLALYNACSSTSIGGSSSDKVEDRIKKRQHNSKLSYPSTYRPMYWDFVSFFTGAGHRYSHYENYILFRGVLGGW